MSSVRRIARLMADWEQRADTMLRQAERLPPLINQAGETETELLAEDDLAQCSLSFSGRSEARSS